MKNHFFKDGDDVAHKEYLTLKMTIRRSLWRKTRIPGTEKDMNKFIGLECTWFEDVPGEAGKKFYKRQNFHSRELVPWEIAQKGQKAVIKFLTGEAGAKDEPKTKRTKKTNQ